MQLLKSTMPPLKHIKGARNTEAKAQTCHAISMRHSDAQIAPVPTGHAMSMSIPPSPSAEQITQALRTQQMPMNKEMSSYHTFTFIYCQYVTYKTYINCSLS